MFVTNRNIYYANVLLYTESDELFQIVYEEDVKHKSDVEMHLWTYRPRITIDHMFHAVQQDKSQPLLLEFLEKVLWHVNAIGLDTCPISCGHEQCIYMPLLHSSPYHMKKQV